jgi:asparagine synthase (glutamine-hydrolysing)
MLGGVLYFDRRPVGETDRAFADSAAGRRLPASTALSKGVYMAGAVNSPDSGNFLAWDGRLDNREDIIAGLDRQGAGHSDAQTALIVYEKRGTEGFRDLIGDWSLAIWDARRGAIVLASDYAGVRPLYYVADAERVLWSSSLGVLTQWTGEAHIDDRFIADFLMRAPAGPRTPYRNIQAVPSGSFVILSSTGARQGEFWRLPIGRSTRFAAEEEYAERLRQLLQEAVAVRLRTPSTVLSELSGGLDSSSVACIASTLVEGRKVDAAGLTTLSYDYPGSSDAKFIRMLKEERNFTATHMSTADFPFVAWDCVGASAPLFWAPRWIEVRRRMDAMGAGVLLTGQLGDLVMGNWWDDSEQVGDAIRCLDFRRAVADAREWSHVLRVPIHMILSSAVKANTPGWRFWKLSQSMQPATSDSVEPAFRRKIAEDQEQADLCWLKHVSPGRRKHFWSIAEMRHTRFLRCPEPLRDVACAHPFAHRPLVEYMLTIPADVVCKPGRPRYLMRRALAGCVPAPILARRSKAAYNASFIDALRPLALQMLEQPASLQVVQRGYIDRRNLEGRLRLLTQRLECNEPQLRRVILLEFWLRNRARHDVSRQAAAASR